jgi:hypothetical protein
LGSPPRERLNGTELKGLAKSPENSPERSPKPFRNNETSPDARSNGRQGSPAMHPMMENNFGVPDINSISTDEARRYFRKQLNKTSY